MYVLSNSSLCFSKATAVLSSSWHSPLGNICIPYVEMRVPWPFCFKVDKLGNSAEMILCHLRGKGRLPPLCFLGVQTPTGEEVQADPGKARSRQGTKLPAEASPEQLAAYGCPKCRFSEKQNVLSEATV